MEDSSARILSSEIFLPANIFWVRGGGRYIWQFIAAQKYFLLRGGDDMFGSILNQKYIFGPRWGGYIWQYMATQIYFWSEVGTTSGRKLRRGPEMEPRRVDRGQWRCSQYNFPIASIVFFYFMHRFFVRPREGQLICPERIVSAARDV